MEQEIIIIGAGASGLMAAIAAARKGSRVLIIEHKEKAGKKILATGNGKCNYTNLVQTQECYRCDDSAFAMKVLSHFDYQKTIQFFEELGIFPRERNGYLYPNSEQAASIVQVLVMECERLKVLFRFNEKVTGLEIHPHGYKVITEDASKQQYKYLTTKVILAAGGCASPKLGSDGSGFILAKKLGHSIIKPLPALVQLKASNKYCKTLSGVRTTGIVTAYNEDINNRTVKLAEEEGELVFTDYGISGIPILQISRFVAKALDKGDKVNLTIDFFPQFDKKTIINKLMNRLEQNKQKNLEEMLVGFLNHKLNYILLKEAKLEPERSCKDLKLPALERLATQLKEFNMTIIGTNSFDQAQVCTGGIPTSELCDVTMESRLRKGLYLTGELVDVDGTCGGYNLQWAWSSGFLAGSSAAEPNRE